MILVYVCPCCHALRIVSRRKEVACLECGGKMELSTLTFLQWSEMSQEEREAYAKSWNAEKN